MGYRKLVFAEEGLYHLYARGVEKRELFLDDSDYHRFRQSLFLLNDERPAVDIRKRLQTGETECISGRQPLVGIVCYCLMSNHFHLLLKEIRTGGITRFLRKLATGYAMYFNEKYKRTGVLFDGRYKAKEIPNDSYLLHLTRYIHLNPLNLLLPDWKEKGVENWSDALSFLKDYRWSSLPDYLQIDNYRSILDWASIQKHIAVTPGQSYLKFLRSWTTKEEF
ncbi:MAG: transposase [Candidatus Omnitrophica bacterium]|nr:transposase [Candidatus Omnitrophota bacterium]